MEKLSILVGSDHGGLNLKTSIIKHLEKKGVSVKDAGINSFESCNYPEIAKEVANSIAKSDYDLGILVCGTGIGMAITANKVKGIRAAVCSDTFSARLTKMHNDANILCLGERVLGEGLALDIVDAWMNAEFEGGRHQIRIDMIEE